MLNATSTYLLNNAIPFTKNYGPVISVGIIGAGIIYGSLWCLHTRTIQGRQTKIDVLNHAMEKYVERTITLTHVLPFTPPHNDFAFNASVGSHVPATDIISKSAPPPPATYPKLAPMLAVTGSMTPAPPPPPPAKMGATAPPPKFSSRPGASDSRGAPPAKRLLFSEPAPTEPTENSDDITAIDQQINAQKTQLQEKSKELNNKSNMLTSAQFIMLEADIKKLIADIEKLTNDKTVAIATAAVKRIQADIDKRNLEKEAQEKAAAKEAITAALKAQQEPLRTQLTTIANALHEAQLNAISQSLITAQQAYTHQQTLLTTEKHYEEAQRKRTELTQDRDKLQQQVEQSTKAFNQAKEKLEEKQALFQIHIDAAQPAVSTDEINAIKRQIKEITEEIRTLEEGEARVLAEVENALQRITKNEFKAISKMEEVYSHSKKAPGEAAKTAWADMQPERDRLYGVLQSFLREQANRPSPLQKALAQLLNSLHSVVEQKTKAAANTPPDQQIHTCLTKVKDIQQKLTSLISLAEQIKAHGLSDELKAQLTAVVNTKTFRFSTTSASAVTQEVEENLSALEEAQQKKAQLVNVEETYKTRNAKRATALHTLKTHPTNKEILQSALPPLQTIFNIDQKSLQEAERQKNAKEIELQEAEKQCQILYRKLVELTKHTGRIDQLDQILLHEKEKLANAFEIALVHYKKENILLEKIDILQTKINTFSPEGVYLYENILLHGMSIDQEAKQALRAEITQFIAHQGLDPAPLYRRAGAAPNTEIDIAKNTPHLWLGPDLEKLMTQFMEFLSETSSVNLYIQIKTQLMICQWLNNLINLSAAERSKQLFATLPPEIVVAFTHPQTAITKAKTVMPGTPHPKKSAGNLASLGAAAALDRIQRRAQVGWESPGAKRNLQRQQGE